jgi:hypothetical protein
MTDEPPNRKLHVDPCNLEQVRAVVRQMDDNFVELFGAITKLRADFDAARMAASAQMGIGR